METINQKKFQKNRLELQTMKGVFAGVGCYQTNYNTQCIDTTFFIFEDNNTVNDTKTDCQGHGGGGYNSTRSFK